MRFKVGQLVKVRVRGGCPRCNARGHFVFRTIGGPSYKRDCDQCLGSGAGPKVVCGTVARRDRHRISNEVVYRVDVPAGPGLHHPGARSNIEAEATAMELR